MSTFTAFERAKINRFINVHGSVFKFYRKRVDDYKEPNDQSYLVATVAGVYHDAKGGYISQTNSNGTQYISKPQPMILCLNDANSERIAADDEVTIGSRLFRVIRKQAVGGFNYAWEISLELIDDGGNA